MHVHVPFTYRIPYVGQPHTFTFRVPQPDLGDEQILHGIQFYDSKFGASGSYMA
jgi:hypothetical protein